ncbi:DUF7019 family protein [Streptomyces sp. NPDC058534]|uniref:DUF7019 family protein n=1 Tax=Streptomyces sp. NPDC058534 TaxID=3346541 RepID=UPI0036585372
MKFLYWSNRRVQMVAGDNGVGVGPAARWTMGVNLGILNGQLQASESLNSGRARLADRVTRALADETEVSFARPPAATWTRGLGPVHFSTFVGMGTGPNAVVLHTRAKDPDGRQVDICLFGSKEHLRPFQVTEVYDDSHSSSEASAVMDLIRRRGTPGDPTTGDDDLQYLAREALKIAAHYEDCPTNRDEPYLARLRMNEAASCEWFAEVYLDLILSRDRWRPDERSAAWHRIVIGAPLWVRTTTSKDVRRHERLLGRRRTLLGRVSG